MAISKEINTKVNSKACKIEIYLGTIEEDLSAKSLDSDTSCNIRIYYDAKMQGLSVLVKDEEGNFITRAILKDNNDNFISNEKVVSLGQIEKDFPGTVELITKIANKYNPYTSIGL